MFFVERKMFFSLSLVFFSLTCTIFSFDQFSKTNKYRKIRKIFYGKQTEPKMTKQSFVVSENVFFFPEEILSEILSWLEVKSLLRCKSVCKVWYAIIKNNQFVDMHVIRNGVRLNTIKRESERLNSDGSKETIRYLYCSCRGLVLEEISSSASPMPLAIYRLSNLSTKCILDLPHPHKRVLSLSIFLNSSTSSYNVVSVYFDVDKKIYNFELLDVGGHSNDPGPNVDLYWRTLNISDFDKVSRQRRSHFFFCFCEDVAYILTLPEVGSSNPKIICVDLVKQACTTLNVPQGLHLNWKEVRFQKWRGKPSVVFVLEEKLNVWVLEDYKKQKWADTIAIPMPFLEIPDLKKVVPFLYRHHEDCLLHHEDCLLYSKNSKTKTLHVYKLESKELCHISFPTLAWVPESLVSLKGMQPEKK